MTASANPPRETEIAVIGGGIMGLFAALFLARAQREVVVLDRGALWAEASGVNAGSLAVQNKLLPLVPYTLEALRMWRNMPELLGRDVGFQNSGGYRIATDEVDRERLRSSAALQRERGVEITWLEGEDLRRTVPWLSERVCAATFSSQDCYANPLLLGPALAAAVSACGVVLCPRTEVTGVEEECGVSVATSRGEVRCKTLVIAAGAWSASLAAMLGVHLPLSLDVNMVSVTEPAGSTIPSVVTHVRGILTLKQVANGTCLIGGGWQGAGDLRTGRKDMHYESLLHNFRLAVGVVPALGLLSLVRQWSGFEGVTPDSLPYFGELPGHPGVFISACARGGWTLGPLLGRLASELILTGHTSMPVDAFAPGRFANA